MSNTYVWTPSNEIFDYARTEARSRAAKQWLDPNTWNLWKVYHSEFNNNYFSPWFTDEIKGNFNGPPSYTGDSAYEITINFYYIYCWLQWHEHEKYNRAMSNYSIVGQTLSAFQESSVTPGCWEGPHPYAQLTDFNPRSLISGGREYTWYGNAGCVFPEYEGTPYTGAHSGASFTANTPDPSLNYWYKAYSAGSWDAVNQYPLKTYRTEIYPGSGLYVMPVGWNENPPSTLEFNTALPASGHDYARGYGMWQWTPWTRLPSHAQHALEDTTYDWHDWFTDYDKHWQISGTMQLIIQDFERYCAMTYPQVAPYYGEWVDSLSAQENNGGAFFTWPGANRVYYRRSITWDDFAAGNYTARFGEMINSLDNPPTEVDDIDRCLCELALNIWKANYEIGGYEYSIQDMGARALYFLKCLRYWDTHPLPGKTTGWSVEDIPRPRDVTSCILDQYHLTLPNIFQALRRRKRRNVRTVLL